MTFQDLNLNTPLYNALDDLGFESPTPIQAEAFNVVAEGGWIGLAGNPEFGGMGMPKTLAGMHEEMMCSADLAFALYPGLTAGACLAINAHASEELKETYKIESSSLRERLMHAIVQATREEMDTDNEVEYTCIHLPTF